MASPRSNVRAHWPNASTDREWTALRATDARARPLGAYYRIADNDPIHVQAAIAEADSVFLTVLIHGGWRNNELLRAGAEGRLKRIPNIGAGRNLHAVAIVGYTSNGFIVQNSWGSAWGSAGFALLSYEDWSENRQDAWVARPGPRTNDFKGRPRIYAADFGGPTEQTTQAETAVVGLDVPAALLDFIVTTGRNGRLNGSHRLKSRRAQLANKARHVLRQRVVKGYRHVVLHAYGRCDVEAEGLAIASRLFQASREREQATYSFVWETGSLAPILSLLRSPEWTNGQDTADLLGSPAAAVSRLLKQGSANPSRRRCCSSPIDSARLETAAGSSRCSLANRRRGPFILERTTLHNASRRARRTLCLTPCRRRGRCPISVIAVEQRLGKRVKKSSAHR